ncbi:MAG TPA: LysR family transcriptional regulator [Terriglobales bacterium]|nr:LysR family transcriptional regulator [Terriglobales bacterium]
MDLFQLETFLTVAREGSFSRAAKKLYRTQPAVSQTVRKLEDEIGESLFDRSSREGILTDTGKVLLEYAEKLLNMRVEAMGALQELREMSKGKLCIAANEFTCLYLLPILNEFRRVHPMVRVTIERSFASKIPDQLLNHSVEMGVLTFRPDDSLRSIVVYRDELAFVVPPTHPLARVKDVTIKQLGAEYFVAHHVPSPYRAKVLETFQKRKVPLHMDVELPTIEAIKKFVGMGNGVALIPAICLEAELHRGELVAVPCKDLMFERRLRVVYRKNATLSHAARAFLNMAEAYAEREGGRYIFQQER